MVFSGPQHLITVAGNQRLRSCQPDTGESRELLQTHPGGALSTFAPNGQVLALSDGEATVQLWRLDLPPASPGGHFWRVLRGLQGRPRRIALGDRVIAVADENYVYLWPLADAERESDPVCLPAGDGHIHSLSLSDDGTLLGLGDERGTVHIRRVSDGILLWTLTGAIGQLMSLAFGPDGGRLAAGDGHGAIHIWRLASDTRRRTDAPVVIAGHAGAVTHLVYTRGGRTLVSASSDGTTRVWRV